MKYEYCNEKLLLSPEESTALSLNVAPDEMMLLIMKRLDELINIKGKDSWRILWPISIPYIWFEREKKLRKKQ